VTTPVNSTGQPLREVTVAVCPGCRFIDHLSAPVDDERRCIVCDVPVTVEQRWEIDFAPNARSHRSRFVVESEPPKRCPGSAVNAPGPAREVGLDARQL
jgi:hypothetical protein